MGNARQLRHWIFVRHPFKTLTELYNHVEECPWAVIDDSGNVWELHITRLGAVRRANYHHRQYMGATNHWARQAEVVRADPDMIRHSLIEQARAFCAQHPNSVGSKECLHLLQNTSAL